MSFVRARLPFTVLGRSLTYDEGLFLFSASEKQAAVHNFNIQNFQGIIDNIDEKLSC